MADRPNIVMIMTDNQGAWTLGCYGNEEIRTPRIDGLATEGMRFENAYCVNSVCSPSRATWFTGLIPSQHGVHCFLGGEKPDSQMGHDAYCTIEEFENLPAALYAEGYACGLSGKWHLGDSLNPQLGFDYWFSKPKGSTSEFYDSEMIWDGAVYKEPRYVTDAITAHAVDYLENCQGGPFFLYVAYNGPYGLGRSMTEHHVNRHSDYYADKPLACFPREEIHPWLYNNRQIINNETSIRGYASAVSGVDDGVGEVLDTLDRLGLTEDTLVIYTSDQGLCGGHHGMWGMGDHSRPLHTFEEAIHIPLIVRHAARVRPGSVFEGRTCNYDFMPTMRDYLGIDVTLDRSPGRSYARALDGEDVVWDGTIFHEFENTRMVRTDRWKYTKRNPDGPDELYDMVSDPGERRNLVGMAPEGVIEELSGKLRQFFGDYVDSQYNLWCGGRSKAGRMT